MNEPKAPDRSLEQRDERRLLDVLMRAGLILALVMLCYRIFSPFVVPMVWAVTLYPLHQTLAARMGARRGLPGARRGAL